MKRYWKRIPAAVRKPLIFIIGIAIISVGIAMLVLPGPGWAAIFLGFVVLATEFAFAERVRDWAVTELKRAANNGKVMWKRCLARFRKPKS